MSKKRKFTAEEREKLSEKIVASWDINIMGNTWPISETKKSIRKYSSKANKLQHPY
jgi:hypothetical protein